LYVYGLTLIACRRSEIIALTSDTDLNTAQSPDIGPPPVSKFVNEDPIKIDIPSRTSPDQEESTGIDPTLSINLEQRRRRKDSVGVADQKKVGKTDPTLVAAPSESVQSLKIGAKRKMSARDEEEPKMSVKQDVSPDEFKFSRRALDDKAAKKAPDSIQAGARTGPRELAVARGVGREKKGTTLSSAGRKALGQKNPNVDVANSPKKATKCASVDEVAIAKDETIRKEAAHDNSRPKRQAPILIKPDINHAVKIIELLPEKVQPEPETPASPDLFSPLSTGPSTERIDSRDTPPPTDFGSEADGHRPSRRARASVSYAEPNLRDKMRRPTKEMVDAVTGEGRGLRLSTNHLETEAPMTAVKIKSEPEADDAWKTMPPTSSVTMYATSPLVDKTSGQDLLSDTAIGHRRRRTSSMHPGGDADVPRSGSGSAISALLLGPRKIKQELKEGLEHADTIEKAMSKLDIYEFNENSPQRDTTRLRLSTKDERHAARVAKRQSSVPLDLGSVCDGVVSDTEAPHRLIASAASRRRQSTLGLGAANSSSGSQDHSIGSALKRTTSNASSAETDTARSERIAGRRRSMMI
jgi:hypothetical protein